MVKNRRRQRRSPSSSIERPDDGPAAVDAPSDSGLRARESPAETQNDLRAQPSPVESCIANQRAFTSPVALQSTGQSAHQSPAEEVENRDDSSESHGQTEVDLAKNTNISSPKRKVGSFGEDPIAETINQLREELRQLRHEREIREREISQMSLLPQKVTEGNAVIASSATKIPGISRSSGEGAGNNGNPVPIASPYPLASTQAASEAAESSEGAEPPGEKFTVTGKVPVTPGIPTLDPSPPRILV